jgi:hypothetical protein
MDKMNDSVKFVKERVAKLVEGRFTEMQTASQNCIQKVNTEIQNLREQLAARHLSRIANKKALPEMADSIENNIQCISVSANSAGS